MRPREFEAGLLPRPIRSYPVANVLSFLQERYSALAEAGGDDLPSIDSLLGAGSFGPLAFQSASFTGIAFVCRNEAGLRQDLDERLLKDLALSPAPADPLSDFLQVRLFHERRGQKRIALTPPDLDFHQALSAISEYPVLLRRLGLVHDLQIPLSGAIPLGPTTVQALVAWQPGAVPTETVPNPLGGVSPRLQTRCVVATDGFRAAPRTFAPDIADGALRLDDTAAYTPVQIDHDGAAFKAADFAANLQRSALMRTADTPDRFAAPALRSAGIAIARKGQAVHTRARWTRDLSREQALQASGDSVMDHEDVVRGWAIDVFDDVSNAWHSLCERIGDYRIDGSSVQLLAVTDEGSVSGSVASLPDASQPHLFQAETFIDWRGWSLSARRPGAVLDANGKPISPGNPAATAFGLAVDFQPRAGSLPLLRFGRHYRLRARAVDLAGNRVTIDAPVLGGFAHATPELRYARFEPVPAPVMVLRKTRTEGGSADRVVLRSNFDVGASPATAERHIVAAKLSATMAETHGLLDVDDKLDPAAYDKFLTTPAPGQIQPWEGGAIADVGVIDADDYGLPFVDLDALPLPYLPDIFADGAVLQGLPGSAGPVVVSFGNDRTTWPNATPFRLVVREGSGAPDPNAIPGALVVQLPKGETATVRLSSAIRKPDVEQMGIFEWLRQSGKPTGPLQLAAGAGRHWMLTPFREIQLVHAVRQPLLAPRVDTLNVARKLGETLATFRGTLELSRKSTDTVDFLAEWDEPIDALAEPTWKVIRGKARAFAVVVPKADEPGAEESLFIPPGEKPNSTRHELGDTKYRRVEYSLTASSRFSEYFLERQQGLSLAAADETTLDGAGVVNGSEAVRAANGGASYARGADYDIDYPSGVLTALKTLTDINIAYVAKPVSRESAAPFTIDVPSSARPAAPKVLYAIPTFGWSTGSTSAGAVSTRTGGTLRVYLDRPWWSSGDGELLGVLLWRRGSFLEGAIPPDALKPFVTQWGQDPLFPSGATQGVPTLAAFPRSAPAQQGADLSIDERSGVSVDVAGHSVGFDAGRKLWYCDIEVDVAGAYAPFVRLALARYQPNSLNNAHLSRVVLADFIKLAQDRTATVIRDAADPSLLHVSVGGGSYDAVSNTAGPSTVEVSLQRLRPGFDPVVAGDAAWEPSPGQPDAVVLDSAQRIQGATIWSGSLTIPNEAGPHRLLVREFEVFSTGAGLFFVPPSRRLVYADAIEV